MNIQLERSRTTDELRKVYLGDFDKDIIDKVIELIPEVDGLADLISKHRNVPIIISLEEFEPQILLNLQISIKHFYLDHQIVGYEGDKYSTSPNAYNELFEENLNSKEHETMSSDEYINYIFDLMECYVAYEGIVINIQAI